MKSPTETSNLENSVDDDLKNSDDALKKFSRRSQRHKDRSTVYGIEALQFEESNRKQLRRSGSLIDLKLHAKKDQSKKKNNAAKDEKKKNFFHMSPEKKVSKTPDSNNKKNKSDFVTERKHRHSVSGKANEVRPNLFEVAPAQIRDHKEITLTDLDKDLLDESWSSNANVKLNSSDDQIEKIIRPHTHENLSKSHRRALTGVDDSLKLKNLREQRERELKSPSYKGDRTPRQSRPDSGKSPRRRKSTAKSKDNMTSETQDSDQTSSPASTSYYDLIGPLHTLFESLISQAQSQDIVLKLLLILNHFLKFSNDETGLKNWREIERMIDHYVREGKTTDHLQDKLKEKEYIILEKDRIINDKDITIKNLKRKVKDLVTEKKFLSSTQPTSPAETRGPLVKNLSTTEFANRRLSKTISGFIVPPRKPESVFLNLDDTKTSNPHQVASLSDSHDDPNPPENHCSTEAAKDKDQSNKKKAITFITEEKRGNSTKNKKKAKDISLKLEKEKKSHDELKVEYEDLKKKLELYKRKEDKDSESERIVNDELKIEYEDLKKKLEKLELFEQKDEISIKDLQIEISLISQDTLKLRKLKGEIEEQTKKLELEKERLNQETERIAAMKSKLEEKKKKILTKREQLEIEKEILEEEKSELDNQRKTLEDAAQFTFMQIAQLQEVKLAIVTGSIDDFMESIDTVCDVDMVLNSDDAKYTLLHWAVIYNQQQIITELLKRGAQLLPSKYGVTPLDIAKAAIEKGCSDFEPLIHILQTTTPTKQNLSDSTSLTATPIPTDSKSQV